jgi:IclR family transcriptional regulator, acetate operon repressor
MGSGHLWAARTSTPLIRTVECVIRLMERMPVLAARQLAGTMPRVPANEPSRGSVQSVERSLDLLERVVRVGQPVGLRELSEQCELSVGTAHRLLRVLVLKGYVRQETSSRRYSVGPALFDLAHRLRQQSRLSEIARPFLDQLAIETGESANLAALDGDQVVYLAHAHAPGRIMRMFTEVGNRAPLHASGTGKLLLAYVDTPAREARLNRMALPSFTKTTITSTAKLRDELDFVRANGFAFDDCEFEDGVFCIAVPVLDASANVVAAISVSGPRTRWNPARCRTLLPRIRTVVRDFSSALGGG